LIKIKKKEKLLKKENQDWIYLGSNELIIEGVDWNLGGFMFIMVHHSHID
jgi:hypothetical protein